MILSGGSGTRLWPLSRELYPKQLLPLVNDRTMIQDTALRLVGLAGVGPPVVVCNEQQRFMVAEQLRLVGIEPRAILLEPVGRNTAPAVALAALVARAGEVPGTGLSAGDSPVPGTSSPDPLLLVLPADHVIRDVAAFQAAVVKALPAARAGQLVTFGVVPTHAESGYGYIRKALGPGPVVPVAEFVEKPDAARAAEFVASGEYLWNSGMFLFSARRYLEELARHAPAMAQACSKAFAGATRDLYFTRVPAALFAPATPRSPSSFLISQA